MVRKLMLLLFVTDSYYPWILGYKIASIPAFIIFYENSFNLIVNEFEEDIEREL